jgi:hypothetical protein
VTAAVGPLADLDRGGRAAGEAWARGFQMGIANGVPHVVAAARDLIVAMQREVDRAHDRHASASERSWYARQRAYRYSRPSGHWAAIEEVRP